MTKLSPAQQSAACGRTFPATGVVPGCGELVFAGIWPSGNVAVKKPGDDERGMGPLTITPTQAEPLLAAIALKFNARGHRRADVASLQARLAAQAAAKGEHGGG